MDTSSAEAAEPKNDSRVYLELQIVGKWFVLKGEMIPFCFHLLVHLISDALALTSPHAARFRGPGQRSENSDPWKGEA